MRRTLTWIGLGFLLLASCGGGGGGEDAGPDLFVGPYRYLGLNGTATTPQLEFVYAYGGELRSDGEGGLASERFLLPLPDDLEESPGSYELHEDHTLRVSVGGHLEEGGLERFGRAAVLLHQRAAGARFAILVARIGVFDSGSLRGDYHWAGYVHEGAGAALSQSVATFDGAGGWSVTPATATHSGYQGTVSGGTGLGYAVEDSGDLTIDELRGAYELAGGVLPGGDLALAVGRDEESYGVALYAFVRAGSGLSDASLTGAYWIVGVRRTLMDYEAFFGTLAADGDGGCAFAGQVSREGAMGTADPFTATYAVAPDGALTLTIDDGATLAGGISPDGTYLTLGGGTETGDDAWFVFGVLSR